AAFASARRTVTSTFLSDRYGKYFGADSASQLADGDLAEKLAKTISIGSIPTGREVIAGVVAQPQEPTTGQPPDLGIEPGDIVILEFYRFDENCKERLKFINGQCTLKNGLEIRVFARAGTFKGVARVLERYLKHHADQHKDAKLVVVESNIDEKEEEQ